MWTDAIEVLSKLKSEIEKADKIDDRYAEMEEKEEFMDGEQVWHSGYARGKLKGLQIALSIIEEGDLL